MKKDWAVFVTLMAAVVAVVLLIWDADEPKRYIISRRRRQ